MMSDIWCYISNPQKNEIPMITLHINDNNQSGSHITKQWITEQIQNRRKAKEEICIIFQVKCKDISVTLSMGKCPPPKDSKPLTSFSKPSQELFKYWDREKFDEKVVNPGVVISAWEHLLKTCR